MALVEIYHVVADGYPVDSDSLEIKEGMLVRLTSAGIRRVTTGDDAFVLGVAGDTKSTTASAMPGVYTGWQNRASDYFDETKASGKMTVYHGGGTFATDQFVDTNMTAANLGHYLIADETTGTLKYGGANMGTLYTADTPPLAQLTGAAGSYPSGIPGVDINGDMALKGDNTNQYIVYKLLI